MHKSTLKPLLLPTLLLIGFAFAATLVSYHGGNATRPPSPYAAIFRLDAPGCPILCWHGVRVGETSLDEAEALLRGDPAVQSVERISERKTRWVTTDALNLSFYAAESETEGWIDEIQVYLPYRSFDLVEGFNLWGRPVGVHLMRCEGANAFSADAEVYFAGGVRLHIGVALPLESGAYRLHPSSTAYMVFFVAAPLPADMTPFDEFHQWRGATVGESDYC